MDLFVMVIAALMLAIIAALAAIFNKKSLRTIFAHAGIGLVVGLPLGYIIAPFILSFL